MKTPSSVVGGLDRNVNSMLLANSLGISREGKVILTEEEYIRNIDYIIKRDFYPDLLIPDENMPRISLDEFMSKYTSEDNASFSEIIEKWKLKNKKQIEKVYEKNAQSNVDRLMLPKITSRCDNIKSITHQSVSLMLEDKRDGSSQAVVMVDQPSETKFTLSEDKDLEKYKNSLMFFPSGITSNTETSNFSEPKIIQLDQLRVSEQVIAKNEQLRALSKSSDAEHEFEDPNQTLIRISQQIDNLHNSSIPSTPIVHGYKLEKTPVIHPTSSDGIMTWGTVESTPFRLPETPQREVVSHKLAAKASKSMRQREFATPNQHYTYSSRTPSSIRSSYTPLSTPATPSSANQQFNALSSAAQQLARRHLKQGASRFKKPSMFGDLTSQDTPNALKRKKETSQQDTQPAKKQSSHDAHE